MFVQINEPQNHLKDRPVKDIAIGIDLGTTFSLAAISQGNQAKIITSDPIPSVVSYVHSEVIVGHEAIKDIERMPERVVTSIKRLMGRGAHDFNPGEHHLYQLEQNQKAGGPLQLQMGRQRVTPLEVSAEILKAIKEQSQEYLKQPVTKAVITVPAYFDEGARLATKDAARLAGIEVLRLVNEPTAAALAYGLDSGAEGLYAIYDLGGGTFDFSLLNLRKGIFQVLATAGDTLLGGDDFDTALLKDMIQEHAIALEIGNYKKALYDIRKMKESLSFSDIIETSLQQKKFKVERTRFEELIHPLIEKTLTICEQALADAKVNKTDIKGVVLVGGSTRVPLVKKKVHAFFNQEPLCSLNPDQVVALGAALQAEALTSGSETLLLDITPLSLGIETMGGLVDQIIERNSPIPISQSKVFTTYQDGQTGLQLHVVQGEREMASDCHSLARFELSGIPNMPAGIARVKVQFSLDADGLLTVMAREETTGVYQQVEIKPSSGLTEADLDEMINASFIHARQDMENRLLIEAKLKGKKLLNMISPLIEEGDSFPASQPAEEIIETMEVLQNQLTKTDRDAIEATISKLKDLLHPFIEEHLNYSLQAIKGRQIGEIEQNLQKG